MRGDVGLEDKTWIRTTLDTRRLGSEKGCDGAGRGGKGEPAGSPGPVILEGSLSPWRVGPEMPIGVAGAGGGDRSPGSEPAPPEGERGEGDGTGVEGRGVQRRRFSQPGTAPWKGRKPSQGTSGSG